MSQEEDGNHEELTTFFIATFKYMYVLFVYYVRFKRVF